MKKLLFILGLVPVILLSGCAEDVVNNQASNAQVKTVKIGVIIPLSGDAAVLGEEVKKILDYQLVEVNKQYQSKNYNFQLVYEDGKCSGSDAVTAFQKLTDLDGVKIILGGACSSESLGIAPLLEDKKVIALSGWSSSKEIEGKSPYLFSLSNSDDGVGKGVAAELGKYKKVALLSEQNDYNQAMKKVVEKALQEKYPSTTIIANEEFPKGSTDFRNQLEKIKAAKPEVVFFNPNVGVTSEALVKQLAEIKDWNIPKIGAKTFITGSVLKISPATLEKTIVIDTPELNTPKVVDYLAKIIAAKGGNLDTLGNYYSATTLDALNVLTQAFVENNEDTVATRQALSSKTYQGYIGEIVFQGKTFVQGLGTAKFIIQNGQVVPLP